MRLSTVNPGYDPRHVLTFQVSLPPSRPGAAVRAAAESLTERIQRLHGVRAVGYAESLPMTRVSRRTVALRTTPEKKVPQQPTVGTITTDNPDARFVSQDFLTAMAIPLVAGRMFDSTDRAGAVQVMLVNRTLAKSGFLGENPIGSQIYALGSQPWTIVGVVEDVRQSSLDESPAPQVFIDYRQVPKEEGIAGITSFIDEKLEARDLVGVMKPFDAAGSVRFSRDRAFAHGVIASFEGRKENVRHRTAHEATVLAAATVSGGGTAQIVKAGLRELTMRLGGFHADRPVLVIFSEGFQAEADALRTPLQDLGGLLRAASRFHITTFTVDPTFVTNADAATRQETANRQTLSWLASETGGRAVTRDQFIYGVARLFHDTEAFYALKSVYKYQTALWAAWRPRVSSKWSLAIPYSRF